MKPTTRPTFALLSILGILLFSVSAQAGIISPFVRAGVDFSKLNGIENLTSGASWNDKLSGWNAGYFGEVGIQFLGSHTLAVEAGWMKATDSATDTRREQIPLLLNYRNTLVGVGPVSLYLGLSAGIMSDSMKWKDDINGAAGSWQNFKSANWVGLYGATAGLGLKLGKRWGLDLGVRALAVSAKAFEDGDLPNGQPYKIGKTGVYIRPNARIALSWQW